MPQKSQAELLRDEADERRNRVICEHAGRIIALQSWIKSGSNCPFSANPQEDIERIKIKIQDHYGPRGIDELRTEVIKLKRGGKR